MHSTTFLQCRPGNNSEVSHLQAEMAYNFIAHPPENKGRNLAAKLSWQGRRYMRTYGVKMKFRLPYDMTISGFPYPVLQNGQGGRIHHIPFQES